MAKSYWLVNSNRSRDNIGDSSEGGTGGGGASNISSLESNGLKKVKIGVVEIAEVAMEDEVVVIVESKLMKRLLLAPLIVSN